MTKKPRIAYIGEISIAALGTLKHRCAWKGCSEGFVMADRPEPPLPRGWRWLAVWRGPLAVPPWGGDQDRDAVLCPKHFAELDSLLEPLQLPMGKAKGSA